MVSRCAVQSGSLNLEIIGRTVAGQPASLRASAPRRVHGKRKRHAERKAFSRRDTAPGCFSGKSGVTRCRVKLPGGALLDLARPSVESQGTTSGVAHEPTSLPVHPMSPCNRFLHWLHRSTSEGVEGCIDGWVGGRTGCQLTTRDWASGWQPAVLDMSSLQVLSTPHD